MSAASLGLLGGWAHSQTPFHFELPSAATTSAGIYDADGRLARTLWSNVPYSAGSHSAEWDGLDDDGKPLEGTDYTAKVVAHNVEYVWDGVIGNTSDAQTWGPGKTRKHRAFESMWDMVFLPNGKGFYTAGYNEGQPLAFRFHQDNYQMASEVTFSDYRYAPQMMATDGARIYIANNGGANATKFVLAYKTDNKTDQWNDRYLFTGGESEWFVGKSDKFISDVAVQTNGNRLFVGYYGARPIQVFHKLSGEHLGEIDAGHVTRLELGSDGNLWAFRKVGSSYSIIKISNLGGTPSISTVVSSGLSEPLALAFAPSGNYFVVADGGDSQQLKAYSLTGAKLWTHGQKGGYDANGPDVTADKFMFHTRNDNNYWLHRAFLAFSPNGNLWVGDAGNLRAAIFDKDMNFVDQIMYYPHSYAAAADYNDPTRVFGNWLEFSVDYSKPLQDSWELVRNWSGGFTEDKFRTNGTGIADAITLSSNGRTVTYAFVNEITGEFSKKLRVFELPASGNMRFTGKSLNQNETLASNGTLRGYKNNGDFQEIYERSLASIDSSNNPTWGAATTIARAPISPYTPKFGIFASSTGPRFPVTDSGKVIIFDGERKQPSLKAYHLGAIRRGESEWDWLASRSGKYKIFWDEKNMEVHGDIINPTGVYDDATAHTYGGNRVMAVGNNVIYGFHGEFWNNGQANQWVHFNDDGLFIGQFGKPTYPWKGGYAGQAGNAFSPALVVHDGQAYLYHNDESQHAGVHRWRIKGLDTIKTYTIGLNEEAAKPGPQEPSSFLEYLAQLGIANDDRIENGDTDGDGETNLAEYIRRTDATVKDALPAALTVAGFEFGAVKVDILTRANERPSEEAWRYTYDDKTWITIEPEQISSTSLGGDTVRRLRISDLDEGRVITLKRVFIAEGVKANADFVTFTIAGSTRPAPASASSFEDFVKLFRLPADQRAASADADGDGMSNLAEYVFHTDPGLADDAHSALSIAGFEYAAVKIDVASDDAERDFDESWQYSYDGSTWTDIAPVELSHSDLGAGEVRRLKFSDLDEFRPITIKRLVSIGDLKADGDSIDFVIAGGERPNPSSAKNFNDFVKLFRLPADQRGPRDDPDGDGLENLVEYIFNTDPGEFNPPAHGVSIDAYGANTVELGLTQPEGARSFKATWAYSYDGKSWTNIKVLSTSGGGTTSAGKRTAIFGPFATEKATQLKRIVTIENLEGECAAIEFIISKSATPDAATIGSYAAYMEAFKVPADSRAASADPDGDHVPNLVEYLYNLDPGLGTPLSSSLTASEYGYRSVKLRHTQAVAERAFTEIWEVSKDYTNWLPANASVVSTETKDGVATRVIQFVALTPGATYLRRSLEAEGQRVAVSITTLAVPEKAAPDPRDAKDFAAYAKLFALPEGSKDLNDDPDGDGISNAFEYLFHTDPLAPNREMSQTQAAGVSKGHYYIIQVDPIERRDFVEKWLVSTDLKKWTEATPTVLSSTVDAASGTEIRELRFKMPTTSKACFYKRSLTVK